MRNHVLAIAAALLIGNAACSKTDPAAKESAPAAQTRTGGEAKDQGGHAPAGVVPGSHEDWCEEHAVPESQCTRCNPDLIAAFKATGDWCEEHGLPESQCLKCNPDLKIVRPPKTEK
jgi:hypothetical protein